MTLRRVTQAYRLDKLEWPFLRSLYISTSTVRQIFSARYIDWLPTIIVQVYVKFQVKFVEHTDDKTSLYATTGGGGVPVAERHSTILSSFRPPTVVWYAVHATSALITDQSAGRPPVAVCNRWRSSLRHCWCSVVEQFASRHCCEWLTSSVPSRT